MKYKEKDKFKIEGELEITWVRPVSSSTPDYLKVYNGVLRAEGRCFGIGDITDSDLDHLEQIEPEIDWDEVKEDTPIWVRDSIADAWLPRHFAYYEEDGGYVYCWDDGCTSHTATLTTAWLYARLMEEE